MTFGPFFEKNFITKLESDPKKWVGDNFINAFESDGGLGIIESLEISPMISEYADGGIDSWVYVFPKRKPGGSDMTGDCVQGKFSSKEVALNICERMKKSFETVGISTTIEIPNWFNPKRKENKSDKTIHYSITTGELRKSYNEYCEARKNRKESKTKGMDFLDGQSIEEIQLEHDNVRIYSSLLIQSVHDVAKMDLPIGFCSMHTVTDDRIEIYLLEKDKDSVKKLEDELMKTINDVKFYLYMMYDCAM